MVVFFATTNKNKFREAVMIFGPNLRQKKVEVDEIQSLDVRKVTEAKAKAAFEKVKKPVIVEDTALYINSWKGLPGPLITWFVKSMGIEKLCKLAGPDRAAKAEACVAYYDGRNMKVVSGTVKGRIAFVPRGADRFDWDRVFIPEGHGKTFAEMTLEEKNRISHRMKAFSQMSQYLRSKVKGF